jgi:multidrug efflux system membrane fusion protein
MKKTIGKLVFCFSLSLLAVTATMTVMRLDARPRTDDAFLLADVANIAPDVSGRIVKLNIRNNQLVHTGDVLLVIDPEPYRLKVNAARARYALAASTLERNAPLVGQGYVTSEQLDQMRAAKEDAASSLALAERDLNKTTVRAPLDGKIDGLNVPVGEYASTGRPLFTIIDTSRWYAIANFRETEIHKMTPGTPVTVYLMSNLDRPLAGHVDSVGWGVLPDDGSIVNGVPRIPRMLNWVRLSQRFPVRVLLDNPPDELMRVGVSAVVVVHYDGKR